MKAACSIFACFSSASSANEHRRYVAFNLNHDRDVLISGYPMNPDDQTYGRFRVFSYNELKYATKDFHFSNKIGEGGFGSVYKGQLRDGTLVAVKVMSVELDSMRGEREFIAELASLSYLNHENLVTLRGCCVEPSARYLVYEYMENNSVSQTFLGGEANRATFTWDRRRKVLMGVARGLVYLHGGVSPYILHRDIKASNILLDRNFTPKVSDFGLAKLLRDENSHVSTGVAGTFGYLAPEYAVTGRLTRKSDVYSFGVLVLQVVTGQPVVDVDEKHRERFLVEKAWAAYESGNLIQVVDPVLNMEFPEEEALRFLKLGLLCVQETSNLRPKMSMAAEMLSNTFNMKDNVIKKPGIDDFMKRKVGQIKNPHEYQESSSTGVNYSSRFWSSINVGR